MTKTLTIIGGGAAIAVLFMLAVMLAQAALLHLAAILAMGLMVGVAAFFREDEDAQTRVTRALPAGAETVVSTAIDLGHGEKGCFLANAEFLLEAPAVDDTQLPDAETLIYDLWHDTDPAFGTEVLLADNLITQTGADASGAAAVQRRFRPPTDVKRYVRLKITASAELGSGGEGDGSDESATLKLVF